MINVLKKKEIIMIPSMLMTGTLMTMITESRKFCKLTAGAFSALAMVAVLSCDEFAKLIRE
jgi:hypothetical protein